jgi:hypothetical protein
MICARKGSRTGGTLAKSCGVDATSLWGAQAEVTQANEIPRDRTTCSRGGDSSVTTTGGPEPLRGGSGKAPRSLRKAHEAAFMLRSGRPLVISRGLHLRSVMCSHRPPRRRWPRRGRWSGKRASCARRDPVVDLAGWHWLGEVEALGVVAAEPGERVPGGFGLERPRRRCSGRGCGPVRYWS